jgi:hypothetical protein
LWQLWTSHGELSVDAVSCEIASPCLSNIFVFCHEASLDANVFFQEMSPTADALDLGYYHWLAYNNPLQICCMQQRSFEGFLLVLGKI